MVRSDDERPAVCLSTQLLATYKVANDAYYTERRLAHAAEVQQRGGAAVQNNGYDDEHGNYIVQIGEEIHGRFLVKELLGRGSFGVVVKALDQRREDMVAVKIIRNRPSFTSQALSEINILTELNEAAKEDDHIVRLRKYFSWQSHLCLVFELLSFNLYDLIKFTRFSGVSLGLVRKFSFQLTKSLNALRSLPNPIIHGDLKPENILLQNPKRSSIKLIDFGSSCYVTRTIYRYIQSRYYRSPEVILGLPYDCGIDTWSLACILIELYTGHPVFGGRTELEQLHAIRYVVGDVPDEMLSKAPKFDDFYIRDKSNAAHLRPLPSNAANGGTDIHVSNAPAVPHEPEAVKFRLRSLLAAKKAEAAPMGTEQSDFNRLPPAAASEDDRESLIDLLEGMLRYDTASRTCPAEWLKHRWLAPLLTSPSHNASAQGR